MWNKCKTINQYITLTQGHDALQLQGGAHGTDLKQGQHGPQHGQNEVNGHGELLIAMY